MRGAEGAGQTVCVDHHGAAGAVPDDAWARLEPRATLPTQSHTFYAALATTLLAGVPIAWFLTGTPEAVDGVLPLCHAPGWLARWRLAGAREIYEPGDALCADQAAAENLAACLARQKRPIAFDRLPASSLLIPALRQAMRGRGLSAVRPAAPCPTLALDPSWSDPAERFNAGRRSDFRRALRKAEDLGSVSFELFCPAIADFDRLFDEAIAVEISGWKREAGTAIAADPAKLAFFRTYLRSECEKGSLRLAFMRINGRAVAMQLAVVMNDRFWLYKIGYDEACRKCSPGTLLMLHSVGEAARTGIASFELLGNAEPWIAELWTQQAMPCVQLRTYPWSMAGMIALIGDGLGWLRARVIPTWR